MEVVGVAHDGTETVQLTEKLRPDVAIVDLSMPHSGLDAIRDIRKNVPETRTLALTMHDSASHRKAVLSAGGFGYVAKRETTDELLHAIREVHAGRAYLGDVTEEPATHTTKASSDKQPAPGESLSFRELEVLRLLALGHTNREISEKLALSKKTIDTFRARILKKLNLRGRAQLVRYAIRHGILNESA
jgi:two-component system response regulator NreC